jgi:hypothetical protein
LTPDFKEVGGPGLLGVANLSVNYSPSFLTPDSSGATFSCSVFNSPRAVPTPASSAAEAAFFATLLMVEPALEDERAFCFGDVLAFAGLFTFDLAPARFEEAFDFVRLVGFFIIFLAFGLPRSDCLSSQ